MRKLSIITVCYNNILGLQKTINSVSSQKGVDFEYIIIDGGSTDGSKTVIEQLANIDKRLTYWVSEPDNGIYHAMNKGIQNATGEYCMFLNAGDILFRDDILRDIFVKSNYLEDIIYGNILKVKPYYRRVIKYSASITLFDFYKRAAAIHHQATFIRRCLFEKYGFYKEDLRLNADWDFFFRTIILQKVSTRYIDEIISIFDGLGLSETINQNNKIAIDAKLFRDNVLYMNFPKYILDDYSYFASIVYKKNLIRRIFDRLSYFSFKR